MPTVLHGVNGASIRYNACMIKSYQRVVIKLGSSVLAANTDELNRPRIVEFIRQVAQLHTEDVQCVLVSSGAVLAGWEQLGSPERKGTLAEKQLLAAVGQSRLMHLYGQLADIYGIKVAQTLLTRDDFRDRRRYLNARNTLWGCLAWGVLPIVNENDVVAIDEIRLGDNDTLAARVASLIEADLLLICTDCEGLYTSDPRTDKKATLIQSVNQITPELKSAIGKTSGTHGTGGMQTKLIAAELATQAGIEVIIGDGARPDIILDAVKGQSVGTHFKANENQIEARKRWLISEFEKENILTIDEGACEALINQGKSLLAIGIKSVQGTFEPGQTIRIFNFNQQEIARGLTQYSSNEIQKIQGQHSSEIHAILGYHRGNAVMHRNDMVILGVNNTMQESTS